MFLNAVVLLLSLSLVQAFEKYVIPEPEIVVYPRGFSVSIPHEPGIRLFAFHGNLNEELVNLHAGQFSKDIIRVSHNKWTFYERRTKLKPGDTISFWLFVVKNGLGYRYDNGLYVVKELEDHSPFNPSKNKPSYGTSVVEQENEVNGERDNTLCIQSIFNITQSLVELQSQYDELKEKNELMKELIEKLPNSRQLTLSGRIPPDGPASSTVSFILREKLNMNPLISSAQRNADGSITFEVSSLEDKLKILDVAKEKLLLTKIFIE